MTTLLLAVYILMWPVIALGVLAVILTASVRDMRAARREHRRLV